MAIYLDETKNLTLYKGQFRFPINPEDRLKWSLVYLMTPNIDSSINMMTLKNSQNGMNFQSYFLEKNVQFIIDSNLNENNELLINGDPVYNLQSIHEDFDLYDNNPGSVTLNENSLYVNDTDCSTRIYYPDYVDEVLEEEISLSEDTLQTKYGKYNLSSLFRSMLFHGRMKNQSDVLKLYERIKEKAPDIKYTYVDPNLYKGRNLYYDWSFYTDLYFKGKGVMVGDKGLDVFAAFINRFIRDKRFDQYVKRTIIIPFDEWTRGGIDPLDYTKKVNPFNLIYRSMKMNIAERYRSWSNSLVVIIANQGFFTMRLSHFNPTSDLAKYVTLIKRLRTADYSNAEEITQDSKLVIMNHLANVVSKGGIDIKNLTGGTSEKTKDELSDEGLLDNPTTSDDVEVKKAALVNKLEKIADKSVSSDDAMNELDTDKYDAEWLKDILIDLQSDEGVKMNKARIERHDKMQDELLKKVIGGDSVKDLLKQFESNDEIKESAIPIDSIDDHWKHVKFTNFNSTYTENDMKADIVAMFYHFTKTTHPMNILNITSENTSTSEDYVDTWTVNYEDAETGKRSTIKVDIPRMVGNRFMKLRGNEKVLIGQLMLLPIEKTDEDTVQIVSNYNKIFVRRKSPSGYGKSTPIVNKMIKVFNKYDREDMKIIPGDNKKVCSRYALPISFIDLACLFATIRFKDGSYVSFNMDNLSKIPFDRSSLPKSEQKLPEESLAKKYMGIYVKDNKREPIPVDETIDNYLLKLLSERSERFVELYNAAAISKRLMFSEASILNSKIPVIVVASYAIGLQKVLDRIGIKYEFQEKRPKKGESFLKFNDGYLVYYSRSDADNMLMNGMMQIDTEEFSIKQINGKDMWLDILDDYGGRLKADGLDNFYDLMMDPITVEICKTLKIPHEYIDALLYASGLLTDSKYNRHSDITGNRLRVNEVIVAHLYSVLAKEYGTYRNMAKRNKASAAFTAKRSAVIDSILTHDQTSSDLSTLSPLLEAEAAAKVTFKGLSGMNSERAFSMEKRTYDESMLGVLSLSTGFASSVGINRQTTIDAGVRNKRGFIVPSKTDKLDNLSTFSIMEAMSPMAVNHDDPMRTAMAFTQTVQHQMLVKKSMPNLVTTGADEALSYMTSNKFSYKCPYDKAVVKDITDDYIVIQDEKTKRCDFIDLRETIQKNSDGGFYITTKLDANKGIKKGSKLKANDIVAYNKQCYSPSIGTAGKDPNALSYNIGTLAKVGILNTAMGFEDSCVVDHTLSEALSFKLVVQKEVSLAKHANVFSMAEVGDEIQEGDPLVVFSDSVEDIDAATILKNVSDDNGFITDIGRKQVHAKVSGKIQDIKIYRTCDISELSESLQKIVKKYETRINKLKKVMKDNKIDREYELEPTYKLPQEGKLKATEGIKIEIYMATIDKFGIGDKLVYSNGLKGVTSSIIMPNAEATSEYRKNEHVNAFLTATGVGARMVTSCMSLGLVQKGIIELARQCQEDLGIEWRPIQDIISEGIDKD